MYSDLVRVSTNPNYGFSELTDEWGHKGSSRYNSMKLRFVRSIREMAKVCSVRFYGGSYYIYDDGIYITVKRELVTMAYKMLVEHLRIVPMMDYTAARQEFTENIRFYNPLEPRRDIVAFSNGVLDLTDYSFHDFHPRYHVTYKHPYPYEPKAKCRKWLSFLHEVLPDKNSRLILQMFLGLGLIERGTAYNAYEGKDFNKVELCLILLGGGSNGKSVVYETAVGIFGKERISSAGYSELTASGDEGMRNRLLLENALFNWNSDANPRTFGKSNHEVFKKIVSGEPVTVRRIGENAREEVRLPYLVFNMNELPYPNDTSLGFIRRLQFVSFEVTIPAERQNKALAYELKKEYPGIFNWVARGAREIHRRKFVFPSSEGSRRAVLKAQIQVNPVAAWVQAYRIRPDKRVAGEICEYVQGAVMMASLEQFCEDNNVEMVSATKFGSSMNKIGCGFYKKRRDGKVYYQVFGCTEEAMREHFVIDDPENDMALDYVKEIGTYINDDD